MGRHRQRQRLLPLEPAQPVDLVVAGALRAAHDPRRERDADIGDDVAVGVGQAEQRPGIDADDPGRHHHEPGLLERLAHGGIRRLLVRVHPAAHGLPQAGGPVAHQEQAAGRVAGHHRDRRQQDELAADMGAQRAQIVGDGQGTEPLSLPAPPWRLTARDGLWIERGLGERDTRGSEIERRMENSTIDLDAYLRRIGYGGSTEPTLATLAALQSHHAGRIPFENLDVLLGRPISLDPQALQGKLVHGGRGGYCFEHNTLFQHVLRSLGFQVAALAARVVWRQPEGAVPPRTHMLLRVELPEGPVLADVGFGGATPTAPLRFAVGIAQPTGLEPFRLAETGTELQLEICRGAAWVPLYRFSLEPQHPIDLDLSNWYVATHPGSLFVQHLLAARPTRSGRHGLFDSDYTLSRPDGAVEERRLADGTALLDVLEQEFLLELAPTERRAVVQRLDALAANATG